MEWLRKIIETAKIEDGKIDIEAVMKQVNAEFPKNAVPKAEFNSVNEQLKTANGTIKELEKNVEGNADLQQKIKDYEVQVEGLKKEAETQAKSFALKTELNAKGVIDPDYLVYKHGGIDNFTFDKEGKVMGLDDVLKGYKETMGHLFKDDSVQLKNATSGQGEDYNDSANLTLEQQIDEAMGLN